MSMFDRFDEMPANYIPDNRFKFINKDDQDSIIIGGSCKHIFTVPFLFSEYATDATIIYSQGIETILVKGLDSLEIQEFPREFDGCRDKTVITLNLSEEDTSLFKYTSLTTFVQMKLTTLDGKTEYSKKSKIDIFLPLDKLQNNYADDLNN